MVSNRLHCLGEKAFLPLGGFQLLAGIIQLRLKLDTGRCAGIGRGGLLFFDLLLSCEDLRFFILKSGFELLLLVQNLRQLAFGSSGLRFALGEFGLLGGNRRLARLKFLVVLKARTLGVVAGGCGLGRS